MKLHPKPVAPIAQRETRAFFDGVEFLGIRSVVVSEFPKSPHGEEVRQLRTSLGPATRSETDGAQGVGVVRVGERLTGADGCGVGVDEVQDFGGTMKPKRPKFTDIRFKPKELYHLTWAVLDGWCYQTEHLQTLKKIIRKMRSEKKKCEFAKGINAHLRQMIASEKLYKRLDKIDAAMRRQRKAGTK